MTGTYEMIAAYSILSAILAYYVNHLRSRIVELSLQLNNYSSDSEE
jgi:hypothetical protein